MTMKTRTVKRLTNSVSGRCSHELGMFFAKLGKEQTAILLKG